jgi:hypothetical protein
MSRRKLLELSLNEDKNVKGLVEAVIAKDKKFIKRAISDLEREIEDIEEGIEKRLSSGAPIDVALIEVTYRGLTDKEETLGLYNEFEGEYLKYSE